MILTNFIKQKNDTIKEGVSLQFAVEKMSLESLRYIVLLDSSDIPIGILTERDVLYLYNKNIDFETISIEQVASKKIVKANEQRELEYALNLIIDHNIRRLVVVDNANKYLGCVEQEEIIFEFESRGFRCSLKVFELLFNESKALSVDYQTTLQDTIQLMQEKNIGSILVSKDSEIIGILTETDILKFAKEHIDKNLTVSLYMHSPVITIDLKTSMHECIDIMKKEKIRRLVVADRDEEGLKQHYIITTKDLLNNLQGNYSKFLEAKLLSYRNTFDSLNDLIIEVYDFGNSQVVSWVNKAAKAKLNINIDDPIEKLVPKNILDNTFAALKKSESYVQERVEIEGKLYRYSASKVFLFDISVMKILLSDFTDLYVSNTKLQEQVGIMSDSINEQEAMQQEIFNQKAIGIGYISAEGEILFVNEYINKLLGYNQDELIGKNIHEVTYANDIYATNHVRSRLTENKDLHEIGFEKRYIHKNGDLIWTHVALSISRDEYGRVKYLIGFIKDIRERKEYEKQLKLSAAVFQNTNEAIMIADKKLKIQAVNDAFTQIIGYQEEEVIGELVLFLRSSFHATDFYKKVWASILKEGYWKGEMWGIRKNGEQFPLWLNISTIKDLNGEVQNYIGVFSDITSIKQSETDLEFLAHHDPLTKLPNRLLLSARIEQAIKRAKRANLKLAVLFLDLDKFKEINDTYGHSYGDEILITVTKRLKSIVRDQDTIARIGGDEFVLLIEDIEVIADLESILTKILDIFKQEILVHMQAFKLTASIGISIYPENGNNLEELVKNADTAMYEAKEDGRNTYRFYTQDMTKDLFTKMFMRNEIASAIENEEFVLYYQPQVSLKNTKTLGAEALVRWNHPTNGLLSPDKFIEIAEQTKLIIPLGKLILDMACKQMKQWVDIGLFSGRLSVNISAIQIQYSDFYETVLNVLEETKLSGSNLEFEITESFMMKNPQKAIKLLNKLKNLGITFAIDDFGTGYSSLSYLKQLPVDNLKIDRSFVMDLPQDREDDAITTTIIAMSKSLGLNVIAEGIETKEQHEFLKAKGCSEGQGYYYSKPLPSEEFVKFLKKT
jgi:diguanylate cyclase (GGDEF)-like protein/PAS domain S-box-containing protein